MIVARTQRFLLLKCDDCNTEGPAVFCKHLPTSMKQKAKHFSSRVHYPGFPAPDPKTGAWNCGCKSQKARLQ